MASRNEQHLSVTTATMGRSPGTTYTHTLLGCHSCGISRKVLMQRIARNFQHPEFKTLLPLMQTYRSKKLHFDHDRKVGGREGASMQNNHTCLSIAKVCVLVGSTCTHH